MTTATPTVQEAFVFPPGALASLSPAGLDLGHVTAKVAFVERSKEQDLLHHAAFPADQLTEAVAFLRSKVGTAAPLRVTGRVEAAKEAVRAAWGAEAVAVAKLESRIAGSHFLIKNVPEEQLELPRADGTVWECSNEMIERFKEMMKNVKEKQKEMQKSQEKGGLFPTVVVTTGRIQTIWLATGENEAKKLVTSPIGSQTLDGLVNLLVGHQSFAQLETTANNGRVQNVDTVVQEMLSTDPNSPYGRFAADMPIFPFGKPYEHNKGLADFAKEDVVASLVRMFAGTSLMDTMGTALEGGVMKIFVGGSLFHLTTARKAWDEYLRTFFSMLEAKTVFVKLQHACAVGTMLADAKGQFDKLEVQRA